MNLNSNYPFFPPPSICQFIYIKQKMNDISLVTWCTGCTGSRTCVIAVGPSMARLADRASSGTNEKMIKAWLA